MKKKDLKTGMYLELSKGETLIVLLDSEKGEPTTARAEIKPCSIYDNFSRLYDYFALSNWTDDLKSKNHVGDVIKIRGLYGNVIWERPQEEEPICTIDGVDYSETTLRSLIKKATS